MFLSFGLGLIVSLIGLVWKQLTNRVNKIEDRFVTKENCKLMNERNREGYTNLDRRINENARLNREDHQKMLKAMERMQETLVSVQECVIKLSAGKGC